MTSLQDLRIEGGPCDGWPERGLGDTSVLRIPLKQVEPPVRGVAQRGSPQFDAVYDLVEEGHYAFRGVERLGGP